jgi:predicted DCC family thiol-disulfide oxidoreductase YuxK
MMIFGSAERSMEQLLPNTMAATAQPMLVYDGSCGFCSRAVQFILRHEHRHDLLFVTRESALGKDLRRQFHLESVESMLWIAEGEAAIESSAVLRAAKYLGGIWSGLAALGALIPTHLRNWAYRLIARYRRSLSASSTSCFVPTPDQRIRFLS